jgi:hypothetical protein
MYSAAAARLVEGLHFSLRGASSGGDARVRLEQHALLLRDNQHILLQA